MDLVKDLVKQSDETSDALTTPLERCCTGRHRLLDRLRSLDALARLGAVAVPVVERPQSVEKAMTAGAAPLERCGERIARLIGLLD